jgi:DNA repair exonuclease SbcCD nuclease subunit
MKIKIAHIADLHIGSNQYGIKQRRINHRLSCLKLANETTKYDLIIAAGDIFDSCDPQPNDICCWMEMCNIWVNAGCNVLACAGNHDIVYGSEKQWIDTGMCFSGSPSNLDKYEAIKHLKPINIVCLNYIKRRDIKDVIQKIDDNLDIIVLHQSAGGFLHSIMRPELDNDDLKALSNKCKYLALGDLHIHRKMKIGNCTIAYPGNTEFLRLCDPTNNFMFIELEYNTETNSLDEIKSVNFTPHQKTNIFSFGGVNHFEEKVNEFSSDFNIFRYLPEFESSISKIESKMSSSESNELIYFHRDKEKKEALEKINNVKQVSENSDFVELAQEEKYLDELDIAIIQELWSNPSLGNVQDVLKNDLKNQINENK